MYWLQYFMFINSSCVNVIINYRLAAYNSTHISIPVCYVLLVLGMTQMAETDTLASPAEMRPRWDIGTSQERDVETDTTTLHNTVITHTTDVPKLYAWHTGVRIHMCEVYCCGKYQLHDIWCTDVEKWALHVWHTGVNCIYEMSVCLLRGVYYHVVFVNPVNARLQLVRYIAATNVTCVTHGASTQTTGVPSPNYAEY